MYRVSACFQCQSRNIVGTCMPARQPVLAAHIPLVVSIPPQVAPAINALLLPFLDIHHTLQCTFQLLRIFICGCSELLKDENFTFNLENEVFIFKLFSACIGVTIEFTISTISAYRALWRHKCTWTVLHESIPHCFPIEFTAIVFFVYAALQEVGSVDAAAGDKEHTEGTEETSGIAKQAETVEATLRTLRCRRWLWWECVWNSDHVRVSGEHSRKRRDGKSIGDDVGDSGDKRSAEHSFIFK